eukprot:1601532-Pyramimonas_sp.AAC.1
MISPRSSILTALRTILTAHRQINGWRCQLIWYTIGRDGDWLGQPFGQAPGASHQRRFVYAILSGDLHQATLACRSSQPLKVSATSHKAHR